MKRAHALDYLIEAAPPRLEVDPRDSKLFLEPSGLLLFIISTNSNKIIYIFENDPNLSSRRKYASCCGFYCYSYSYDCTWDCCK